MIFFYHTAITGFDLLPGSAGDASSINYIMEHFWLWINQIPQHLSFWNMPFYYPSENTLAYSDVMVGGALFYVPIRFFVRNPFSTLQIWMGVMCILNYTLFYLLLRRFKYSHLSSAIGSFIFAFGIMRYFKMNHLQFYMQYPMVLSLLCISYLKSNKHFAIGGFFIFLALEFWTVYTLGYMFCFTIFVGGFIALLFKSTRRLILDFIKGYYKEITLYGVLFIISLIPLAKHYLMLGTVRGWAEVFYHFTDFTVWFRNISLLDNTILKYLPEITKHEETCGGIGLITMLFAFFGLWKFEKYRKPIFTTLLFLMLLCVKYGDNSPWLFIYKYIPGADGMRVVSRIYFIFLIFYCFGIAEFFKSFNKKLLIFLCVLLLLIEQLPSSNHTYLWSKKLYYNYTTRVANNLSKSCKVLYYNNYSHDGKIDMLIMWIANFSNTYSANGCSGVVKEIIWKDNAGYCYVDIDVKK
ncbi:hypothetical protein IKE67_03120 [bacterium]|nr:hypothetical protein [bacterium]